MTAIAPPDLTDEQAAAAHAGPDGAFLIAAGPGTGKTFTIVERFRWLVEEAGLHPASVFAVTFSEAAAAELRERLQETLGGGLDDAWIGTFHGLCARLLRDNAYLIGMPRDLRVLDELGQRLLIERLQARLRRGDEPGLEAEQESLSPDDVASLLKEGPRFALKLKGRGVGPDEFRRRALATHAGLDPPAGAPAVRAELEAIEILHSVYQAYEARLRDAGRLDFDDLILRVIAALGSVPEFHARCRATFRHILVDEFQDTNSIQLELIRLLAEPGFANVTVVGDAKQSIYGWRDAEIENIRSRFPGRRLPLTVNRRSVQEILDCATSLIRRDADFADEPDLVAARGDGGQAVSVLMAAGPRGEAELVAAEIRRLVGEEGRGYGDIALLSYSIRQLPKEFEEEFRRQGIPYVTTGSSGFFDREEVKDVLALLRLVADPMDDGALVRVLQGPVVRVDDAAMYRLALRRTERRAMRLRDCLELARSEGWPELAPATAARLEQTLLVVDELSGARAGLTVADVLNRLLDRSGYLRHCRVRSRREGPRAILNVRRVVAIVGEFERESPLAGIPELVGRLDRMMQIGLPVGEAPPEEAAAVRFLTIHGAKGREFDVVFVVNVRRPNPRDGERLFFDPDHLGFVMKYWRGERHPRFKEHQPGSDAMRLARQERRRAVYVALTRARDRLFISAGRDEAAPADVELGEDDHFTELLGWALSNPLAARVVTAEQLPLPVVPVPAAGRAEGPLDVAAVTTRLERLAELEARAGGDEVAAAPVPLSFSQIHQFEICPVRYRYRWEWDVPVPPDDLLSVAAAGASRGGAEVGVAVHAALAAWHRPETGPGRDLLALYEGPETGRAMLERYLGHPLAQAPTLGCEVEFNLRLPGLRLKGAVDRVCQMDGVTVLVDYKTNANLDRSLRDAYAAQLRLYGLAAAHGLLPGGTAPRLLLFDMRGGSASEVEPDPVAAEAWAREVAGAIANKDFELGPRHAGRPCFLCAYRPLCPHRR